MEKCPLLYEYACFVTVVRKYLDGKTPLAEAIDKAVTECIRKGILADVLRAHRTEVTDMLLKEYDEEFHISCEKKISYEDGFDDGVKQEKARTEAARQEADAANQKADAANRKAEILARKLRGSSEEEIAVALNIPLEEVRNCLEDALGA